MAKRRLARVLRVVAFNLALMLVLAELVALAGYYRRTGKLYYLARPSGRSAPLDENEVEDYRLHPYFGFVHRPNAPELLTNNHGFVSAHDYPYSRRRPEEYLVGLFGGSVAAALAAYESEHRVLAPLLAENLGRRAEDVTVLNFAQGGFKQPQQLLVLGYFRALGQELDLVVNVDGFNEVALGGGRNADSGVAVDMPSIDHLSGLRTVTGQAGALGSVERMLVIRGERSKFARAFNRAWSGDAWELELASGFLFDFLVYKYHLRRYQSHLAKHTEEAAGLEERFWLTLSPARGAGDEALARAVEIWARGSELLDRAQKSDGGAYLQLVQPNQYLATARIFSDAERAVAFSEDSPFADYVRRGYPRLAAEAAALSRRGVPVVSLLELFDGVAEPVYADDCCHYNDTGQRLLAEAVARAFAEHYPRGLGPR